MMGLRGKAVLAGSCLLTLAWSAQAEWKGSSYSHAVYVPVYYVPVYYYAPVYPACATTVPSAKPQPAPPSKKAAERVPAPASKEPPLMGDIQKKPPVITESRSLSVGPARSGIAQRCQVGFWNLTGRDVTLTVDGQAQLLPSNRAITLDLERSFAWQIDQRAAVSEHVPAGRDFHEVILRQ
jgi:hypothetical protein